MSNSHNNKIEEKCTGKFSSHLDCPLHKPKCLSSGIKVLEDLHKGIPIHSSQDSQEKCNAEQNGVKCRPPCKYCYGGETITPSTPEQETEWEIEFNETSISIIKSFIKSILLSERKKERERIIEDIGKWKSDCKVYHNKHVDTADKIKGFNFALECVLTHLTEDK